MATQDGNAARVFYTGAQFVDWVERNCWKCAMSEGENGYCSMELAIMDGVVNGAVEISKEHAERIGYKSRIGFAESDYTWQCPEKVKAKKI